jgi:AdoMet-dependent rRNA methyltransferase SPB1
LDSYLERWKLQSHLHLGEFLYFTFFPRVDTNRNVSAEIFVVCRNFKAPKHIDPKFLDPKHVFKDLAISAASGVDKSTPANDVQANVFQPEKKRRKRDGYADGDYTLFKKAGVAEFVGKPDPISLLGTVNKLTFETDEEKA